MTASPAAILAGLPGVQAVARGFARVDGVWTPEVAWLAFVHRKRARASVRPHERLPRRLGNLRIDVVSGSFSASAAMGHTEEEGDPLSEGPWSEEVRPLCAGYSLGLKRRTGTLGLVVAPATGPAEPLLLSSSHVLNRRPDGKVYPLYQPGGRDRRAGGTGPIAWAWRYTRLHPRQANTTEGALARVRDDVAVEARHPMGWLHGTAASPPLGTRLWKVSRTTGVGTGRLVAKDWAGRVRIGGRRFAFRQQWMIDGGDVPVSLSGDSGAAWITGDGRVAALNFAGGEGGLTSISMPAAPLFDRLDIRLPTRQEAAWWRNRNPRV